MLDIKNEELEYSGCKIDKNLSVFLEYKYQCLKKPLVYFGAGRMGQYIKGNLAAYGVEISCFVDNDIKKQGGVLDGVNIYSYDQLRDIYAEYDILLGDSFTKEKIEQLNEKGEKNNIIILDNGVSIDMARYSYEYFTNNKSEFCKSYNMLYDEISKNTFLATIKRNITGNMSYFDEIKICDDEYFPTDILEVGYDEVFVDAGAYRGDTIVSFMRACNNSYKSIIPIEADRENFDHLECFISEHNLNNVEAHCVALHREDTMLTFNECGSYGSMVIEDLGNNGKFTQIKAMALDELLNGQPVTFIKMDIEGAELAALEGARATISKFKPKMAICVYHKAEDMITIPQYIKSLVPEYKFYLRQHTYSASDLVLYAVL